MLMVYSFSIGDTLITKIFLMDVFPPVAHR